MFQSSSPIFFLTGNALLAARVNLRDFRIETEQSFPLGSAGLTGALFQARKEFGQGARFILPEEYLYVTQLEVNAPDLHLRPILEKKILEVFPETLGGFAWDYELIETKDEKAVVEISGVVKDFGEVLKQALKEADYRIGALIPESYALAQFLPHETVSLLIHEREEGWITALIAKQRVITTIFLEHIPTESDVRSLIDFGTERKKVKPTEAVLSLRTTDLTAFSFLDLPQQGTNEYLNPLMGAARIKLHREDSARLDLPLRREDPTWFTKFFKLFP